MAAGSAGDGPGQDRTRRVRMGDLRVAPAGGRARRCRRREILLAFEENGQPLERRASRPRPGESSARDRCARSSRSSSSRRPTCRRRPTRRAPPKVSAEYRFHEDYDHNAGASQNAVVAIRVKPLPKGTRDVDWQTPPLGRLARRSRDLRGHQVARASLPRHVGIPPPLQGRAILAQPPARPGPRRRAPSSGGLRPTQAHPGAPHK